ncbi:MAG: bifunctional 23S rRNA (guanine(2069)-N(7))-methyltransferase RlmK/23S rRNA (guanine(2445)-N(2))-methyltransferase RlmL [Sphaerochaetaceae bacterium]|nr:bifunctional 23S rRNA (guanine(2069)-N(7))-methyltransferase RlmK/23S rRNA (guanine(2445)-N(2))-methyltransferase RlmL [Sphaerochaetaceae bacterium]
MIFFASASANQNDLVEKEVINAGGTDISTSSSGVEFSADLETAYRFCLNSRSATRVVVLVHRSEAMASTDDLYEYAQKLPWESWVNPDKTFAVTETVTDCRWIRNSHFAALRLKDAIVERIRQKFDGERPNVDRDNPDVVFHLHVNRNLVSFYIDFGGRDFTRRGYRKDQTEAVMGEFMAASILYRSDWYKNPDTFLDPFCGSGTICIEAALMATNTAPGLINPDRFAFLKLPIHDEEIWQKVLTEAEEAVKPCPCRVFGWDISTKAVEIAKANAARAGVLELIEFSVKDFTKVTEEDVKLLNSYYKGTEKEKTEEADNTAIVGNEHYGSIVTDPPYGVRLDSSKSALRNLYSQTGRIFYDMFGGWKISVLSSDAELLSYIEMKPERTNKIINGGLDCQLAHYYVFNEYERKALKEKADAKRAERLSQPLSPGAQMAYNRLVKNLATVGKEMAKQGVTCYRLYDADMPEYSAAIDFYEGKWITLQEYAAPSSIPEEDAARRLDELVLATERATGIDLENIYVKRRERQRGDNQYVRRSAPSASHFYMVQENGHHFSVNFKDYLDTGLFLDHRPVRKMIEKMADNKRFLNLFCYTGSATVHAAAGNALSTVSVDTSATYLDWAQKNMFVNGFSGLNHFYYKSDSIEYLKTSYDRFDLIFCDPPTFSNNKSRGTFDVQRDHVYLIRQCMKHLSKEGTLIFSTNFTRFRMDEELEEIYRIEDITEETIGDDFKRSGKIHKCYKITHKAVAPVERVRTRTVRKVSLKG